MDLHEWELLDGIHNDNGDGDGDGDGFLQVNPHGVGGTTTIYDYCSSFVFTPPCSTATLVHMNYFICPPSPSPDQFIQKTTSIRHLLPLPIHFQPPATATNLDPNLDCPHITTPPIHPLPPENNLKSLSTDPLSQVFFKKKMKETDQFVDMIKVESSHTRSNAATTAAAGGIILPPTAEETANFLQFDDEANGDPNPKIRDSEYTRNKGLAGGVGEGGGLSKLKIFKWSLSGMAAVAATVCIIVLSNRERKHPHGMLNQIKFRFQICASANYDDKHRRMKARRGRWMKQRQQQGEGEGAGAGRGISISS